jgi:uncharacterized protein
VSLPGLEQPPVDPPWPDPPPGWRHDAGDPDHAFPVPFNVFDALGMVLWTILAQILIGVPALALGMDPDRPVDLVLLTVTIQIATFAGVMAYLRFRGALSWRLLGPVRPGWRHVFIGMGLGVAALVIVLTVAEMTNRLFGPFENPEQALLELEPRGAATALLVVATVALAPLVEETVFRGLLFQSVRRKFGLAAGMVVSALVFAYIHVELLGNPPAMVSLVVLGLWLAGALHRTGSLLVPMIAHGTYNGLVLAAVALMPDM